MDEMRHHEQGSSSRAPPPTTASPLPSFGFAAGTARSSCVVPPLTLLFEAAEDHQRHNILVADNIQLLEEWVLNIVKVPVVAPRLSGNTRLDCIMLRWSYLPWEQHVDPFYFISVPHWYAVIDAK